MEAAFADELFEKTSVLVNLVVGCGIAVNFLQPTKLMPVNKHIVMSSFFFIFLIVDDRLVKD